MVTATLIERHNFIRVFNVITPDGNFEVIYDGEGLGYERVLVNGEVVSKKKTIWWYAPEFKFEIGSIQAIIYVKVWVWLKIRSFVLEIGGERVYSEGDIK